MHSITRRRKMEVTRDAVTNGVDDRETFRKLIERKIDAKLESAGFRGVKALTLTEWTACEPPKAKRILGSFLLERGAGVIAGGPGAGKTVVATTIAVHVALGKEIFGWKVDRPRSVLVVDAKSNGHEIKRRVRSWCRRYPELAQAAIRIMPLAES